MLSRLVCLIVTALFLAHGPIRAEIFTVTTTAQSGPGSIGQAILDANAHPNSPPGEPDRIHFAIPGTDVQSIQPYFFTFPDITDPVFIDGFTQTGSLPNSNPVGQGLNSGLKIELDGRDIAGGNALTITCGNTTIRGLIINRFDYAILCRGGSGNVITGNFIGTDRTGTFAPIIPYFSREPRQMFGVGLENCANSRVGGRSPELRNLLSGDESVEVYIRGAGAKENIVEGNLMGTEATGMASLDEGSAYGVVLEDGASSNLIGGTAIAARNVMSSSEGTGGYFIGVSFSPTDYGIAQPFSNLVKGNFFGLNVTGKGTIDSDAQPSGYGVIVMGHHNVIGGTEPGAGNIISGNRGGGILIGYDRDEDEATENLIQGNFIGTDESGTMPLGNGRFGVWARVRASHNTIGGTQPGAGNRIAFTVVGESSNAPSGTGVAVGAFTSGPGNAILGNLIYGNAKLGIDLGYDLNTPNDPGDADTGANNLQNYPVLTSAGFIGAGVAISGTLDSIANKSYRIEFFGDTSADASGFGEGRAFLGAANVVTGTDGIGTFDLSWPCPLGTRTVSATATDPDGNTSEFSQSLSITGTPAAQLLNISTRLGVQTGENVLIGGFIVTGMDPKKVLIRAIGPSLPSGGTLADPTLELFQGNTLLASNDNWKDTQRSEIEATGIPPSNDLESAIVRTLAPGAYTAVVHGVNNVTGIGLVEVYDLEQAAYSRLANISTRGLVESGNNVMIGGLIIRPDGGGTVTVVVRAIGPTLGNFGISGALQDPTLDLLDSDGAVVRSNNNWKESQQAEIEAVGLQPGDDRESALLQAVAPGNYTAIVRGNGDTTGVALVEVYHLE